MTLHRTSTIRGAAVLSGALVGALFLAAPSFAYPGNASSEPMSAPSSSYVGYPSGGQAMQGFGEGYRFGESYPAAQTLCPDGTVRFGGFVQSSRDGAQPTTECTGGMRG
jgi:hypothetical protein